MNDENQNDSKKTSKVGSKINSQAASSRNADGVGGDGIDAGTLNALSSLKSLNVGEPSPFMKTRVLANVREQERLSSSKKAGWLSGFKWVWPALVAGLVAGLTVALIFVSRSGLDQTNYQVGQPYMVRFDLRAMESNDIAYAEVVVGKNVRFSSKKFTQVSQLEKLTLDWESLVGKQYLPVVIEGVEAGQSRVVVYFYNEAGEVVAERQMKLQFSKS